MFYQVIVVRCCFRNKYFVMLDKKRHLGILCDHNLWTCTKSNLDLTINSNRLPLNILIKVRNFVVVIRNGFKFDLKNLAFPLLVFRDYTSSFISQAKISNVHSSLWSRRNSQTTEYCINLVSKCLIITHIICKVLIKTKYSSFVQIFDEKSKKVIFLQAFVHTEPYLNQA